MKLVINIVVKYTSGNVLEAADEKLKTIILK